MAEAGKGTIVFVHGAWCDGSVWTKALMPLAHEGFKIHTAQLPLQTFAGDVDALNTLLDHVEAPVLLVSHSYGGAVATAAGTHEKVKALAYVTAFTPEPGEVFGGITGMFPAKDQLALQPDARGFIWMDAEFGGKALGHDLHRGMINLMCVTQKPTNVAIFGATLDVPAWKTKPSTYLVTTDDHILAPETQHALAKRIGAKVTEVAASHLVVLSQPEAVTEFVRESAGMLVG